MPSRERMRDSLRIAACQASSRSLRLGKRTLDASISRLVWRQCGVRRGQSRLACGAGSAAGVGRADGLSRLLDQHVRFVDERVKSGAANSTPKLTSIIAGMADPPGEVDR